MVELWLQSNITSEWVSLEVDNSLSISLTKSFAFPVAEFGIQANEL